MLRLFKILRISIPVMALVMGLLLSVSCQREREWIEPTPGQSVNPNLDGEATLRLAVVAPAAMDLIKNSYAEAPRGYAHQVISWLGSGVGKMQFIYGPSLPDAHDTRWNQGPYAGASGAHFLILVALQSLEEVPALNGPGGQNTNMKATVQIRALNALGQELWSKTHVAEVPNLRSPKFNTGISSASGRAVWNANKKCINALKDWLDSKSDNDTFSKPEPVAAQPPVYAQVKMLINSEPIGADVLIDDVFKGNTPLEIYLPAKEQTLRIERGGYKPWSRRLVPAADVDVKPVLERLP